MSFKLFKSGDLSMWAVYVYYWNGGKRIFGLSASFEKAKKLIHEINLEEDECARIKCIKIENETRVLMLDKEFKEVN